MPSQDLYTIPLRRLDGTPTTLEPYRGDVLLIVNVASRCGLTPQYEGLEQLHRTHAPQGFTVLGFPCNQFGAQEPGTAEEIAEFCDSHYAVSFPLFTKIDVNGEGAHPIYRHLKEEGMPEGEQIPWNFAKFILNRSGEVIKYYPPTTTPEEIEEDIVTLLTA